VTFSRNMTVQLLALYTDPERYNTQCYRQTDRRTDGQTTAPTSGGQSVSSR